MSANKTATRKKNITPITFTVTLTASKINENGTFSSFQIDKVKGPNGTARAVAPPQGGGSIYLKVDSLEGIEVVTDAEAAAPKTKLF